VLEAADVEHIKDIMPEAKIIYVIRNPIERAWSAVKTVIRHQIRRRRTSWDRKEQLLVKAFSSPAELEKAFQRITTKQSYQLRGDYVRTLAIWRKYFPESQFFVGFFEDIVNGPMEFLSRVFDFLGVDSSQDHISQVAFQKINPSPQKEIPSEYERALAELYHSQMIELSEMFGGHAEQWLHNAEKVLRDRA
jgi:hypothetical protein